jgi:hypothetical protein
MITNFSYIQTFYINSDAVSGSDSVSITSVGLWFKLKPKEIRNSSGIYKPGVIIALCEVENNQPILSKMIPGSLARLDYDNISTYNDASGGSFFRFGGPITISTDRFYGIVVILEDPCYELWTNKIGDTLLGTNSKSTGSVGWVGSKTNDGNFYKGNASGDLIAISDTDLKFSVIASKYSANSVTVELVNKNYEFLTINAYSGVFVGGEYVFQNSTSYATGTINVRPGNSQVIGTSTDFTTLTKDSFITVTSGSNNNVLMVDSIVNTTFLTVSTLPSINSTSAKYKVNPVAKIYSVDRLNNKVILSESNSSNTKYFAAGNTIIGTVSGASSVVQSVDVLEVDAFRPYYTVSIPSNGESTINNNMSYYNGANYVMPGFKTAYINEINEAEKTNTAILSRSLEVMSTTLYGVNRKSSVQQLTLQSRTTSNNIYEVPRIKLNDLDIELRTNSINSSYYITKNGTSEYDSEVDNDGIASTKHISKKITFATNRFAEDVRVYLTGYRPKNTEIKVYCRLHNSTDQDLFENKSWTPLTLLDNSGTYSSSTDKTDLIEFSYGLPKHSETANALPGTFTTTLSNPILIASGVSPNTYLVVGDAVKVYSPIFPRNYQVGMVTAANNSTVTLGSGIKSNDIVGSGFRVDKLKYPYIAFTDPFNFNVCQYFNSDYSEFNKYDAMQVKIVLISTDTNITPLVDRIEVIGVSA